jgi:hypothetical protein
VKGYGQEAWTKEYLSSAHPRCLWKQLEREGGLEVAKLSIPESVEARAGYDMLQAWRPIQLQLRNGGISE